MTEKDTDINKNAEKINYFAMTDVRGSYTAFGIKPADRLRHMYVIGKTGMGKSTMLENMAIQDIQNGEGMCFIDPHGSAAEKLLDFVPQKRIKDVIYFAPFDIEYPLGFNVLEDVGFEKRHLVVAGLMSAFKRIWVDAWSSRMEYILQNTLMALLEYPDSTLVDINRMLTNKEFRNKVLNKVTDVSVLEYWKVEVKGYTERFWAEATPAIQNKIGQFIANPLVRNIIAQPKSSFDIREMMDNKKIFIVNLSKGRMGEQNADLLGSMLVTKMYLSAMSRAEEPAPRLAELPPFYLYVDEFQSVVNDSFANILSEARKYKLALIIAHQYVEQMDENIRNAVFGNVGTTVTFRVGPFDAETLETMFKPTFLADDIVNLGFAQIYLTLMIDGIGSTPFSARTIEPINTPNISFAQDVITYSRDTYSKPRAEVENLIEKSGIIPTMSKNSEKKQSKKDSAKKQSQTQTQAQAIDLKKQIPQKKKVQPNTQHISHKQNKNNNGDTGSLKEAIKKVSKSIPKPNVPEKKTTSGMQMKKKKLIHQENTDNKLKHNIQEVPESDLRMILEGR